MKVEHTTWLPRSTRIAKSASASSHGCVSHADGDVLPVNVENVRCLAHGSDPASVEPHGSLAQPGDLAEIVAHEQDGRPGADQAPDLIEASVAKCPVDDGEHLVEDVDVGREAHADRE